MPRLCRNLTNVNPEQGWQFIWGIQMLNGYILYDLSNNVFFVNKDVDFKEQVFLFQKVTSSFAPVYVSDDYADSHVKPHTSPAPSPSTEVLVVTLDISTLSIGDNSNIEPSSDRDS